MKPRRTVLRSDPKTPRLLTEADKLTARQRWDKRPGRRIVVDRYVWKWQAGRTTVCAYCETGLRKLTIDDWKLMGISEWERGQGHKAPITPAKVAAWIASERTPDWESR